MLKTTFRIAKMDCPSEEQMIRMKLSDVSTIHSLNFDIAKRQLTVYHTQAYAAIFEKLDSLQLDTSVVASVNVQASELITPTNQLEKSLLWQVLIINFIFFIVELSTGLLFDSMGLIADGLDMLADSIVYGLALFAVGGSIVLKKRIAKFAGYFQLLLAVAGFVEVVRRFFEFESMPSFFTMIFVSVLALIGNAACLFLLQKSKSKEAHMQASVIFTSNDVIVNMGVILAGTLVYFTNSKYPDLLIGSLVFFLVAKGAFKILKLSE